MNEPKAILIAAVLASTLTLVGTWFQALHQRKSARDERIWNRRAELYIELLHLPYTRGKVIFLKGDPLEARIEVFASNEVRKLHHAAVKAHRDLDHHATEENSYQEEDPTPQEDPEFHDLVRRDKEARANLRERIRRELGMRRHRLTEPRA